MCQTKCNKMLTYWIQVISLKMTSLTLTQILVGSNKIMTLLALTLMLNPLLDKINNKMMEVALALNLISLTNPRLSTLTPSLIQMFQVVEVEKPSQNRSKSMFLI